MCSRQRGKRVVSPDTSTRGRPRCPNAPAGGHDRARERFFGARGSKTDTTPTARRASASVLCGVVQPDLHEIGRFEGLEPDSWKSRPSPWCSTCVLFCHSSVTVGGVPASWRGVGYRVLQWRHGMPNMWGPDPNRTPRPLALGRDVLDYLQHGE